MIRAAAAALLLLLALAACARVDADKLRICASVLPLLVNEGAGLRITTSDRVPNAPDAVRVEFVVTMPDGSEHWRSAICAFGRAFSGERTTLTGIALDAAVIGPGQLFFIERFLRERGERTRLLPDGAVETPAPRLGGALAFLAQALVNGLASAGILALVAAAYALLAGITHRINLAFGEFAVIGAYGTLGAFTVAAMAGGGSASLVALAILAGMAVAGLAGRALGRLVVEPLVVEPGRMLIVATIGVALVIQEFLRLTQGAGQRWLPPVAAEAHLIARGGGFAVTVTSIQLIVAAVALAAALALVIALRLTRFGRNWRAVADDPLAARLCGVDPRWVVRATMMLAGALAGLAGVLVALAFGNVHYAAGASLGLKAILAAILGGIGSVGGALLGGFALGMFEALWSAYLPIVFRDVAVYALLSLLLVTRPDGLFGLAREAPRTRMR